MFASGQVRIIDGAMATELERRGARLDDPLWSARILREAPELIRAVHLDYFRAGADIAITATYQATFAGFAARGLAADEAHRLLRLGVTLAREARDQARDEGVAARDLLVAASVGPFGAHRHDGSEYTGEYGIGARALIDFHRRQLDVLAEAGADLLAFETVPSRLEAEALLRLLEDYPGVRAWLSFACRDAAHVGHGERFADCVATANDHPQIVAVGLNCTAPVHVEGLLRAAAPACRKPLLAYPNSGEAWVPDTGGWRHGDGGGRLADLAPRWRAAGATLLGGCCRTGPADIRALAGALQRVPAGRSALR